MADLSSLSDAELLALSQQSGAAPQAEAPPSASPLASMSNAELLAMQPQHPVAGPSGDTMTDIGRRLGTAGATAVGALMSTPMSAAQGVDWLGKKVGLDIGAAPALGSFRNLADPTKPMFPDMPTAREWAFKQTGGTEYQPETWLGRRAQDALTGGALALTGNWRAIPAAIGGSATSGAAVEAAPKGMNPLLAAIAGFIPGAHLANTAARIPMTLASTVTGAKTEPYAAFTRLELPTQLGGTATGAPDLINAEKWAARMPGSEGVIGEARTRLVGAWQDKLNEVAGRLGTAATPQEAGTSLQSAAQTWLSDFKARTGQLWSDFYTKVPQTTPVNVGNYQQALTNVLGNFAGAPAQGAILRPAQVESLSKALGVDLQAGGGTLPWEAVKNIRSAIGAKIDSGMPVADMPNAALKQLYKGLTADMEAGAGTVGPDAVTAFHKANAATAAGHDLLESHIQPILNANTPEQATTQAFANSRQGGSRLGALTFNLPGAAGDLGAYALRSAATNTESPTALARAMTGPRPALSPEAQRVLFPQAETQQSIADLATTGRAMGPGFADLANSPTATHAARNLGRIALAGELAREGHDLAGKYGAAAGGALGLLAPNITGRVAQATALNPYLTALYGRAMPLELQQPSLLGRALIAPAVGQSWPPAALSGPATTARTTP